MLGKACWERFAGLGLLGMGQVFWDRFAGSGLLGLVFWVRFDGLGLPGWVYWIGFAGSDFAELEVCWARNLLGKGYLLGGFAGVCLGW